MGGARGGLGVLGDPRPGSRAAPPRSGPGAAPTPLRTLPPGLGRSAAISQSTHIHRPPLCEWVLMPATLSTLKRWSTASDGQVTGLSTACSLKPENKGAEEQARAPLLWRPGPCTAPSAPLGEGPRFQTRAPRLPGQAWPQSHVVGRDPCRDPWLPWNERSL